MNQDHTQDRERCPVTGEPREDRTRWCFTDDGRPGLFNSCYRCNPGGPASGREALQRVEDARRKATED